jgi:hypothetical protein
MWHKNFENLKPKHLKTFFWKSNFVKHDSFKILTILFVETLKKCLYGETRSKEKFFRKVGWLEWSRVWQCPPTGAPPLLVGRLRTTTPPSRRTNTCKEKKDFVWDWNSKKAKCSLAWTILTKELNITKMFLIPSLQWSSYLTKLKKRFLYIC